LKNKNVPNSSQDSAGFILSRKFISSFYLTHSPCMLSHTLSLNPEYQKLFETMKALIAQDCMLPYPDHNNPFDIYINAREYQLRAVIVQEGILAAYYLRKLTEAQKKYTSFKKELLGISMTFKEFNTMLHGAMILIPTTGTLLTLLT
jgi:hypothetical protein